MRFYIGPKWAPHMGLGWDLQHGSMWYPHGQTHMGHILREIKQIESFINILLSPGQNYMCVENKMTNNGPMCAPHGQKFQYRTHIGPFWALCPDSAHMGPICPCLLGVFSWAGLDLLSGYSVLRSHTFASN